MNHLPTDLQNAYRNAQVRATLHRMNQREQAARVSTGEPCRCPESVLDCTCGSYEDLA